MKKTILVVDESQFMKNLLEKSISKSVAEAKPQPLNDLLCPTFVGIDMASGPDRTVMKCACGWFGEPDDMKANASGIRTCPGCGASGGIVGA